MSRLLTPINAIAFPWEVDTIKVGTTSASERSVTIGIQCGELSIFNSVLSFDSDGTVQFEDLGSLFEAYAGETVKECAVRLNGSTVASWLLIPCRVETTDTAVMWCEKSFLTVARGERLTHQHTCEYLSWWQSTAASVTLSVTAFWASPSGMLREERQMVVDAHQGINTHSWKVSEWTPPAAGAVLSMYSVAYGDRIQHYRLQESENTPVVLCFINSFGVYETMTFFGSVERDTKPTRSSAVIGGKTRNYDIESIPIWKAYTGELPEGMSGLLDDVIRAKRVWLQDGGIGDVEVTLTDNEWKRSSSPVESLSGTVSWRLASHRQLRSRTSLGRIFDETFDETFN